MHITPGDRVTLVGLPMVKLKIGSRTSVLCCPFGVWVGGVNISSGSRSVLVLGKWLSGVVTLLLLCA